MSGKVRTRVVPTWPLNLLCELLQYSSGGSCVRPNAFEKSYGKGIRLKLVLLGVSAVERLLPDLAEPGTRRAPTGGFSEQK